MNAELDSGRQALRELPHAQLSKGEFETTAEFERREREFDENNGQRISAIIRKQYIGRFLIEPHQYDADNEVFAVQARSAGLNLEVNFRVPRSEAATFKQEAVSALATGRFWLESDANVFQAGPLTVTVAGHSYTSKETGPGLAFLDWRTFPLQGQNDPYRIAAFAPNGTVAAVGSENESLHAPLLLLEIPGMASHQLAVGRANALAFSNDSLEVAAYVKGVLKLWKTAAPHSELQLAADDPQGKHYATAFSAVGRYLASAYGWSNFSPISGVTRGAGVVRVFDRDTGKLVWSFQTEEDEWPTDVAFSPRGDLLLARFASPVKGTRERTLKAVLWRVADWAEVRQVTLADSVSPMDSLSLVPDAHQVSFTPDGLQFAATGASGSVRFWSAETGKEMARAPGRETYFSFSPDGSLMVSAQNWNGFTLSDVPTRRVLRQWPYSCRFPVFVENGNTVAFVTGHELVTVGLRRAL